MAKKTARDILDWLYEVGWFGGLEGSREDDINNALKELRRLLPKKKKPVAFNINTPIKDYENNGWNDCLKAVREGLK